MSINRSIALTCGALCFAGSSFPAYAQPRLRAVLKATVPQSVYLLSPPGDTSRVFTVQRSGSIRVHALADLSVRPTPFLTVSNVNVAGERGMLSMAFHPQYSQSGWFYFYYSRNNPTTGVSTVIARARVSQSDPDVADPTTVQDVLVVPGAQNFHQGGWIGFGPDGLLYIPLGENQQPTLVQSPTSLRGKILRIDVDGPDDIPGNADDDGFPDDPTRLYTIPPTNPFLNDPMPDEVWAYGLRNPFRCSFDRVTGDFWVCDVGSSSREEVNRLSTTSGGANLGWPCSEGNILYNLSCSRDHPAYVPPFFDYANSPSPSATFTITSGCAIVGGHVYRGTALPCLQGSFVFADSCRGLFSVWPRGSSQFAEFQSHPSPFQLASLAEDGEGELYLLTISSGQIYKIVPDGLVPGTPDCDNNGYYNLCEIRLGLSLDTNNNNIPDGCEGLCTDIDFNNNRVYPEDQDVIDFFNVLAGTPCDFPACDTIDFNRNAVFPEDQDVIDFFIVLAGGSC